METLAKIKEFVTYNKVYILGVSGLLASLVAWSGSEITGTAFITVIWVALQTMFLEREKKNSG